MHGLQKIGAAVSLTLKLFSSNDARKVNPGLVVKEAVVLCTGRVSVQCRF